MKGDKVFIVSEVFYDFESKDEDVIGAFDTQEDAENFVVKEIGDRKILNFYKYYWVVEGATGYKIAEVFIQ